nr:MAG TPA: hypothetical protein [Caudoviricetes sp.]
MMERMSDKYTKELKEIKEFLGGFENEKVD